MSHAGQYSGVDNLEVMQEAVNYNRFLIDTVRRFAPPAARTLDFGAGAGTFAAPLSALGMNIVALEPDAGLRKRLEAAGLAAVATPEEIPDRSLDYAYSLNVLEHIPDDVAALQALRSKLVPDGVLFIYVPAFPILYTSMDRKVGHVRRYTRAALIEAVDAAGFDVTRVEFVDSLGWFASLAFKALDRGEGDINRGMLKLYDRFAFPISRLLDSVAKRWLGKNLLLTATPRKQA